MLEVLRVDKKDVIKVSVKEGKILVVEWYGEWKDWEELHDSAEVQDVLKRATEMLEKSGGMGKGSQKGWKGHNE